MRWGNSKRSVVETITYGRSDVMPSFQGAMADQDIADVAEFIWSIVPEKNKNISIHKDHPPKNHVISQKNNTFTPKEITIGVNDSIIVFNDDNNVTHMVQPLNTPPTGFQTKNQKYMEWDRITFPEKGTFEFNCSKLGCRFLHV